MAIIFTDDIVNLIERTRLCFVATVNPDGTPNLSPKGSLKVLDDVLYFADIASPHTVSNLKSNPAIEINFIDIFLRRGYRIKGSAVIFEPDDAEYKPLRQWVLETHGPTVPVHHVIRVNASSIQSVLSPAYTCSDPVPEEKDIVAAYYKKYNVQPLSV